MATTHKFDESFKNLNPEQREAVECLDGPLLVIAGPGTGKTQLLSLRAANILAKCDVAPRNILCLTYTEAGAEAMRKRLIELIGRDAYGIEVSTFHGFASSIRSRYPEYFTRPATDTLVTSLHQQEIFDRLLKSLPFGSPLGGGSPDMPAQNIGKMIGFVSKIKRSGVDYDTLGAIAQQNIDAAAWLTEHSELLTLACERASAALAERFEEEVERVCAMAPTALTHPVECPAGTYVPIFLRCAIPFAAPSSSMRRANPRDTPRCAMPSLEAATPRDAPLRLRSRASDLRPLATSRVATRASLTSTISTTTTI